MWAGGRWDDPLGEWPTLYVADSAVTAFAETIAFARTSDTVADRIYVETDEDAADPEYDPELAAGHLPRSYFEPYADDAPRRVLGECRLVGEPQLVDMSHADTHHELNLALGVAVRPYGVDRFDRGVMMSQDRRITRTIAGHLHDVANDAVGLLYESRYLPDGQCVALWERAVIVDKRPLPVTRRHPALRAAAGALHIELE